MRTFLLLITSVVSIWGQALPSLRGAGYEVPVMPRYGRGQVISIFAPGLNVPNTNASTVPLPTNLAGVTVTAVEKRSGGFSADLPIFGITRAEYFGAAEAPDITVITVQMPSLSVCLPESIPNPCWYVPHLVVTVKQNGTAIASEEFVQTDSKLHILNACDTSVSPFLSASVKLGQLLANCYPIVSHADGTIVTGQNPARAGETVTIYATGVGWAVGSLGVPARSDGVPIDPSLVLIGFDFRPDIVGGIYRVSAARPASGRHPDYAGAVGGLVGIYQISVTLPTSLPPETRACRGLADTNVGVNVAVASSFDGIRLCVVP